MLNALHLWDQRENEAYVAIYICFAWSPVLFGSGPKSPYHTITDTRAGGKRLLRERWKRSKTTSQTRNKEQTSRDINSLFQSSSLRSQKVNVDLFSNRGFNSKFNGCFVLADASKLGWGWAHMFFKASTRTLTLKFLPIEVIVNPYANQ